MLDLRRIGCEMHGTSSELCPVEGFGIKKFSASRISIGCFTVAGLHSCILFIIIALIIILCFTLTL